MKFWNLYSSNTKTQDLDFISNLEKNLSPDSRLNYVVDFSYNLNYWSHQFLSKLDLLPSYISNALDLSLENHTLESLSIALKFLLLIALLIFIRGGIPRYRFDHLTKMGWIKYLSLVLASLLVQFLLIYLM